MLAALLVGLTGVPAPAAGAHTALTATEPAADGVLTSSPSRVSATFNEPIQPMFAAMTVIGPDQNLWSTGDTTVDGRVVGVELRPLGPAGSYTANYRVTSADGHVVSGSWSFTLSVAGPGRPSPVVPAAPPAPQSGSNSSGRSGVVFALAGAAIVTGLVVWLLRRPRQ